MIIAKAEGENVAVGKYQAVLFSAEPVLLHRKTYLLMTSINKFSRITVVPAKAAEMQSPLQV